VLTDEIARFLPSFLRQKYTPSPSGQFAGQQGYGYRSIEEFVKAAEEINAGTATVKEVCDRDVLATVDRTARVTAMLEAGRVSLDNGGAGVRILYPEGGGASAEPIGLALEGDGERAFVVGEGGAERKRAREGE